MQLAALVMLLFLQRQAEKRGKDSLGWNLDFPPSVDGVFDTVSLVHMHDKRVNFALSTADLGECSGPLLIDSSLIDS
jgi:hypothetical protein